MSLLVVDPGIRGCGVAVFRNGVLVDAAYVKSPCRTGNRALEAARAADAVVRWAADGHMIDEIAQEWMQVYVSRIASRDRDALEKDPNDLLPLAAIAGAVAAAHPDVDAVASYLPREWKGQLTKPACHARAESERLTPAELRVWRRVEGDYGSLAHNAKDAICIGLHHLGRGFLDSARRRVYPGARE